MFTSAIRHASLALACALLGLLQACGGGGGYGGGTTTTSAPPPAPVISSINGSAVASGSPGTGFIVYGNHFGALSGSGMTAGYSVDFRDAASNAIVASASYAGSGWTNTYIKAVVPGSGLTVGTTYKVTVTTPNGTSNAVEFTVTAAVAFSPSTIAWGSTSALPAAIQGFPSVVAPIRVTAGGVTTITNYVYTFGGNTAASSTPGGRSANVASVYSNVVNDGSAGGDAGALVNAAWTTESNALPAALGFAAGAAANGFNSGVTGHGVVYVLGGLDDAGAATSTVYYAALGSNGSVGAWATTTPLPAARYTFGAAIFRGRLYVAGGYDAADTATATVHSAPINSDGTLGAWSPLPALPAPVAYHALVTTGGTLYVLGGTLSAAIDPVSTTQSIGTVDAVDYNSIEPDGTLAGAGWTANPNSLIKAVEKHTVVAIGSYVLASGGLYAGANTGSTEQTYAVQSTVDASLEAFQGATGSQTIINSPGGYNFYNHSAALYVDPSGNPHVLILGGQTVGDLVVPPAVQSGVWYMK
ncbi:MAG TPA: hypothetical protein VML92_05340 [Steroidobacteraceae bacterium]|nr:hypothetical protein [Steroidobacteraceae bacterium]